MYSILSTSVVSQLRLNRMGSVDVIKEDRYILNQEGQSWIKSVYMAPVGPLGILASELQASQAGFYRK